MNFHLQPADWLLLAVLVLCGWCGGCDTGDHYAEPRVLLWVDESVPLEAAELAAQRLNLALGMPGCFAAAREPWDVPRIAWAAFVPADTCDPDSYACVDTRPEPDAHVYLMPGLRDRGDDDVAYVLAHEVAHWLTGQDDHDATGLLATTMGDWSIEAHTRDAMREACR